MQPMRLITWWIRDGRTTPISWRRCTPAICMPCGFSPEGLPYSIQFAGRRLSEAVLCRIAHAYEQATDWHHRHPPDPAF